MFWILKTSGGLKYIIQEMLQFIKPSLWLSDVNTVLSTVILKFLENKKQRIKQWSEQIIFNNAYGYGTYVNSN